jgi:uncharacterized membrane protein (DUF106 family)
MLDRWYKTTAILVGIVIIVSAIVGPTIGGIYWLVQLDRDVADLQEEVTELQTNVVELQRGQAVMLEILQKLADDIPEIRADLGNHTHDANGRAQFAGR